MIYSQSEAGRPESFLNDIARLPIPLGAAPAAITDDGAAVKLGWPSTAFCVLTVQTPLLNPPRQGGRGRENQWLALPNPLHAVGEAEGLLGVQASGS